MSAHDPVQDLSPLSFPLWGSRLIDAGARGHLNADSGLGDWPEGHALLQPWLAQTERRGSP